MDIKDAKFLVIDFETVTPKGVPPEPIELGVAKIDGLKIDRNFKGEFLIKPPAFAPVTIFDVRQTGITPKMLENKPNAENILTRFQAFCAKENYVFVAQNAKYEKGIIDRLCVDKPPLNNMTYIDTILLAKKALPNLKTYKLDAIVNELNLSAPTNRHRAFADCLITAEVFIKLVEMLNIASMEELLRIGSINNKQLTFL